MFRAYKCATKRLVDGIREPWPHGIIGEESSWLDFVRTVTASNYFPDHLAPDIYRSNKDPLSWVFVWPPKVSNPVNPGNAEVSGG